ncbi:SLC13 family permease [Roseibacillus persicicus]|uniref:Transporter n=1 Tax=Roseibacillus persicicus TaxID=454148 RepID=A0A918TEJ0_9BACT|nr:DASS family sodium-coupled anion symporter [Roseibacillus persicicus]GHC42539.1 transporter [Roseibacillus persicicus]
MPLPFEDTDSATSPQHPWARPVLVTGLIPICFGLIWLLGLTPLLDAFSTPGRTMLALILLGLVLWATELIPAYATGLLLVLLQMIFLGNLGSPEAEEWKRYFHPLGSPLVWMFLGAFAIGRAAEKTGLAAHFAQISLRPLAHRRKGLLLASLGIAFVMSMLLSNTATAAIMLTLLAPLISSKEIPIELKRGLLLGVSSGSGIGGMGTLIGSPSNLIAAQALTGDERINFAKWLGLGLPPALFIAVFVGLYLWFAYFRKATRESLLAIDHAFDEPASTGPDSKGQRLVVGLIFLGTIVMWSTEALHHWAPAPVSLLALVLLLATGILSTTELRSLPWETLLLIASGLALGTGMSASGLTTELANLVPEGASPLTIIILVTALAVVLSNMISNTATAAILVPLAIGLAVAGGGQAAAACVPVGLACSCALLLPVSTPPNAIVFSTGLLQTKHFLVLGGLVGILGPIVIIAWNQLLF